MSIAGISASSSNPYPGPMVKSKEKMPAASTEQQVDWKVDDIVATAVKNSHGYYGGGIRFATSSGKDPFILYQLQRDDNGNTSVQVHHRLTDEEIAKEYARRAPGTLATTGVVRDLSEPSGMTHRAMLDSFVEARLPEFKEFVHAKVDEGAEPGSDWQELFFLAKADSGQISEYNRQESAGNEAVIVADKRGRYLAQNGVDITKPLSLTKLDDGSYAEVMGHPQKKLIEQLVNSKQDLWDQSWNDYLPAIKATLATYAKFMPDNIGNSGAEGHPNPPPGTSTPEAWTYSNSKLAPAMVVELNQA